MLIPSAPSPKLIFVSAFWWNKQGTALLQFFNPTLKIVAYCHSIDNWNLLQKHQRQSVTSNVVVIGSEMRVLLPVNWKFMFIITGVYVWTNVMCFVPIISFQSFSIPFAFNKNEAVKEICNTIDYGYFESPLESNRDWNWNWFNKYSLKLDPCHEIKRSWNRLDTRARQFWNTDYLRFSITSFSRIQCQTCLKLEVSQVQIREYWWWRESFVTQVSFQTNASL